MDRVYLNTTVTTSDPTTIYRAREEAAQCNNQGLALEQSGQYHAAEQKYLRSLEIKLQHFGENSLITALSHNALGELYIAMNRLDDAERHLELAIATRNADGPTFDAASSRENLAVVYEMRGNLVAAKRMRKSTGMYACGNYRVCFAFLLSLKLLIVYSVPAKFSTSENSSNAASALYVLFQSVLVLGR